MSLPKTMDNIQAQDIARLWKKTKAAISATWTRTSRRWRISALALLVLGTTSTLAYSSSHRVPIIPHLRLEYSKPNNNLHSSPASSSLHPSDAASSPSSFSPPHNAPYNASKVALLIENRPLPMLAPLLLHFISVVPPDWRFRFMGSPLSVSSLNQSHAVRAQVAAGKLDLTYIPLNMSTDGQEMISRFLTNLWLYETVLQPAEWLLVFQTDSILCANSRRNLNDYLDYDWVGSPWNPNGRFGGNGGLSMRRVSSIVQVLRDQVRAEWSEPEDVWLTERLGHRPGARMANGTLSMTFSGEMNYGDGVHRPSSSSYDPAPAVPESLKPSSLPLTPDQEEDRAYYIEGVDDWREGFYEPMGYHTGGSGQMLHAGIWGDPNKRKHIWNYCPEVKMTLAMDVAQYVPGNCNANWKRDEGGNGERGSIIFEDLGYGKEYIDGVEYPVLPPNVVPW
ncbi:hypothetical protein F5Y16DRAFT_423700 [Xylariaceae sp. FL0255]|nr:hypothetical protein F5Y16DRAFT_423700 [Xylariaceae sp. FL0255]